MDLVTLGNIAIGVFIYIIIKENFPFHWFGRFGWFSREPKQPKIDSKNFERHYNIIEDPYGVDGADSAVLYYIQFMFRDVQYYKIGITSNSTDTRFQHSDRKYLEKVLFEKRVKNAYKIEQQILSDFDSDRFPIKLTSSGYTEMFNKDILGLTE